jgi:ABC-2 type transport system permease protein
MHSILLIAKREYLERVRSKVFRITTVLVPVLVALLAFGGNLIAKKSESLNHLAIASNSPQLANTMKDQLASGEQPPASVEVVAPATDADRTRLAAQLDAGSIDGYLWLTETPGQPLPKALYYTRNSGDFFAQERLEDSLSSAVIREQLLSRGLDPADAKQLVQPIKITTLQEAHGTATTTDAQRNFKGIYLLVFVLYAAVIFYGTDIARSVTEEKSSRIFEVLLSTARADSLMMGKLLGVGGAAITQVAVWIAITVLLAGSQLAARAGVDGIGSLGINGVEIAFFAIFFTLGFFFYAALSAALGSTSNSSQEVQQFAFFIISPLVISVFLMSYVMSHPNTPTSVILSLIPPFTPIIMYLRICAQTPPVWQLALSIVLLIASIWAIVWVAARIYRIGILMYGKRPTLPEMMRWLKYS